MKKQLVIEVISFLFILLLVYAAVSKIADFQKFSVQLGQSPMLARLANFVAWFIPVSEVVTALLLVFTITRKIAFYCALSLMVMFTTYIIVVTNFSKYVPCSCGGVLEKLGWTEHLIFNLFFVFLAIVAIVFLDYQGITQTKRSVPLTNEIASEST